MTGGANWLSRALAGYVLIAGVLLAMSAPAIWSARFPDPDDVLRMVQLRDLLGGQGWFDLTQHRLNAPEGGVAMHWSRLVDLPLALVTLLLMPFVSMKSASMAAAIIVPLITLAVIVLLVARLAKKLAGRDSIQPALIALALCVPVLGQIMPLRIDHHGWQIALALLALAGSTTMKPPRGGLVAGAALAGWMAISIEGLPMAVAFCGVMALRWVYRPQAAAWLVSAMASLATTSVALFLLTRGLGDLASHCDAVSPIHLAVFTLSAAGVAVLAKFDPRSIMMRLAGLGAIALAAGTALLAVAPQCVTGGGFAQMDPLVEQFWLSGVAEGQPIWKQAPAIALQALVLPIIGLIGCWQLAHCNIGRTERDKWLDYAMLLGAALLVTVFVVRAGAVAGAFAAVPAGMQARRWLGKLGKARPGTRLGLGIAAVGIMLAALAPGMLSDDHGKATAADAGSGRASDCQIAAAAPALARLPAAEIFAPIDLGPNLLLETRHSVVASAHHRGQSGLRQVIAAYLGSPDDARKAMAARGSRYLALCAGSNEISRYRAYAPGGFAAQLAYGERFDWLEPVPTGSNLMLYRIKAVSRP